MLASRMSRIASSPTLKGLLAAERLRSQGMDVVDLGAGEPDFPTPDHVKAAAKAAIDGNFTKYTANAGTVDLRTAELDPALELDLLTRALQTRGKPAQ